MRCRNAMPAVCGRQALEEVTHGMRNTAHLTIMCSLYCVHHNRPRIFGSKAHFSPMQEMEAHCFPLPVFDDDGDVQCPPGFVSSTTPGESRHCTCNPCSHLVTHLCRPPQIDGVAPGRIATLLDPLLPP